MPAEWQPHAATWLAWPHHHADWPGKFEPIPWVYTEIIRNLARHERVELIVNDAPAERQARKQLERANADVRNVRFHRWPTNRSWLRDSGCIFCTCGAGALAREGQGHDSSLQATKFRFNAWAKYSNWRRDEKIGSQMANAAQSQEIRPLHRETRVVLEGGSIDVNGQGTLLTTEECLLSKIQQRNPKMRRKDYETLFANYLGAPHTIWLGKGIHGDDTHGHVDDLARFVDPTTIVTVVENDPEDANFAPLQENLALLKNMKDQDGRPLLVETLPMPAAVYFDGQRLPASYANFYVANKIVLVPTFNDLSDRTALNTVAKLFPTREVIGIYCRDLVLGLGTIHCMTQQQPSSPAL
jgi:agmatine deiminase